MYFLKISLLALCGVTIASPILKQRDAATVITDIAAISSDLTALSAAIAGFDGNIANALPVSAAASELQTDYGQATTDANASDAFPDSSVTTAAVALVPGHVDGLNALVAKKSLFDSAGVTALVLSQLQGLSAGSAAFWSAVQAKVPGTDTASVSSASSTVAAAYASAIAAFS